MDPNALARQIEQALAAGAVFEAFSLMTDLAEWIGRGGFAPDWHEYPRAHGYWVRHGWKWQNKKGD